MERALRPEIPHTLEDLCDWRRMALLVFDMQSGLIGPLPRSPEIIAGPRRGPDSMMPADCAIRTEHIHGL